MRLSTVDMLGAAGLDPDAVARIVFTALDEDLGPARLDVTSIATIAEEITGSGDLVARADGVVAGLPVAVAVFDEASGGACDVTPHTRDGERVKRGEVLATVTGPVRSMLTAERTALNLLCRMSGVATHTRAWADALDAGVEGVVFRGRAEAGDKTMVDALLPARDALRDAAAAGADLASGLAAAAAAAEEGMRATTPLVAKKGRASYLGVRSAGHQDPGATSAYLLLKAAADVWG